MPTLAIPQRYRNPAINPFTIPGVMTPPEGDMSPALDPRQMETSDSGNPAVFGPPPPPPIPTGQDLQPGTPQAVPPIDPSAPTNFQGAEALAKQAMPPPGQPATSLPPDIKAPAPQIPQGTMPPPGIDRPMDAIDMPPPGAPNIPSPDLPSIKAPPAPKVPTMGEQNLATASKKADAALASNPGAPKSNWGQRLATAILAVTRFAPATDELVHPKWVQEERAFQNRNAVAQEGLKNAKEVLGAEGLDAEREALAAQRDAQIESGGLAAEQKRLTTKAANDAVQQRIAETRDKNLQDYLEKQIHGHDAQYQDKNDPLPPGWKFIEDDTHPGKGYAVSPAYVPLPPEMKNMFPGYPDQALIPYSLYKTGSEHLNQMALEQAKADAAVDAVNAKAGAKTPVPGVDVPYPPDVMRQRLQLRQQGGGTGAGLGALSPDDIAREGEQFALTGVMSSLGNGSREAKEAIIHAKNEYARTNGFTPHDMALAKAAYAGDTKSLNAMLTQRDNISAFEQTAGKNLSTFLALASKIPDTGIPWLNAPIRTINEKLLGSPEQAAINAARTVANNEIAKVTSGGGMSQVLSDHAREEVKGYNPETATYQQTLHIARVLQSDMANRHASMNNVINVIGDRMATMGIGSVQDQTGNGGGVTNGGGRGGVQVPQAPQQYKMTAINPSTQHKIGSNDGGQTWFDVQTGKPVQ